LKKNDTHPFIFDTGVWLGEGDIAFNMMPGESVKCYMRWSFTEDGDKVTSMQEVEVAGGGDVVKNVMVFSRKGDRFAVVLKNDDLGELEGTGIVDEKTVAWEFRKKTSKVEGYEAYKLQDDGSYIMKAEYRSPDDVTTTITGKIWKKSNEE